MRICSSKDTPLPKLGEGLGVRAVRYAAGINSAGKRVFQALKPPARATAVKPLAISWRAARALVASLGQVQ